MTQQDQEILESRIKRWDLKKGPRVGDFVKMLDGTLRRFTHSWGDRIQTTCKGILGLFYLGDGYVSYSGGLDPSILKINLKLDLHKVEGRFWFFHNNQHQAYCSIEVMAYCRIFNQTSL